MNRRKLIQILGVSAVGLVSVPWWIDSWTDEDVSQNALGMKEEQLLLLNSTVSTIIPKTDIPGAGELKVDKFVITMVADCYEKSVQEEFLAGFPEIQVFSKDKYDRVFMDLSQAERLSTLREFAEQPKPENKKINFVGFLKGLTVTGFMTSEYIQTNQLNYEMVPSRFNGSLPVSELNYKSV